MIRNKIDLHLHLDGSLLPETVYEISRMENIEPECKMSLDEIRKVMVIQPNEYDPDFLTFEAPIRCMQSEYAIKRVMVELIDQLIKDDVKYAEIRFAPQYHLEKGLTISQVVQAACDGLNEGLLKKDSIHAGIILCCMHTKEIDDNIQLNKETILAAKEFMGKGVVAIDLAGYEENLYRNKWIFDLAKEYGIPTTCHSEFTVEQAIKFETDRIGHGYQFGLNEKLIELAIEKDVVLEMCPISSVKYDYGLSIDETHPFKILFDRGVKVTVNTDNRTVLDTNLEKEYECLRKMRINDQQIEQINRNAISACFADKELKEKLLALTD